MTIIAPGSYVEYAGKRQLVAAVLTNGGERYYMLLYPKHGVTSLVPADILESPSLETERDEPSTQCPACGLNRGACMC